MLSAATRGIPTELNRGNFVKIPSAAAADSPDSTAESLVNFLLMRAHDN